MSATDMLARWESRRGELARLHAQVDGAALVEEFLSDLEALAADEQPVTLTRAAAVTGYSADHLSRLIKSGKLKDHGRKHAPRVKASEPTETRHSGNSRTAVQCQYRRPFSCGLTAMRRIDNAS